MNKYYSNFFKIEDHRRILASKRKYRLLSKMYSKIYSEIEDINTPSLWDKLNKEYIVSKTFNKVAYDRHLTVKVLIKRGKVKVLNIGVGTGFLERLIMNRNKISWYGIDFSQESVRILKKKYPEAIFCVDDLKKLNINTNNFDYIVILEVLEHIQPRIILKVLLKIKKLLTVKGRVILSIPLNENLKQMVDNGYNPSGHVRIYSPELLIGELKITGFKVTWRKFMYAFKRNYKTKTLLAKFIIPKLWDTNSMVLLAEKL